MSVAKPNKLKKTNVQFITFQFYEIYYKIMLDSQEYTKYSLSLLKKKTFLRYLNFFPNLKIYFHVFVITSTCLFKKYSRRNSN